MFGLLLTHVQLFLLILPSPPIRNLTPELLQLNTDGGIIGALVGPAFGAGVTGVGTVVVGADVGVPGVGVGMLVGLGVG